MFIRLLAVSIVCALIYSISVNAESVLAMCVTIAIGIFCFRLLAELLSFIIDGPQTAEQKAKEEQAIANIKEIWAKALTNK